MALTLSLDYPNKIVSEPGSFHRWGAEQIASFAEPEARNIWADPLFSTLMLKPLQLDPTWLGTTNQLESVIRLADMNVDAGDLANLRIVERSMGGDDEPWVWYWPVGPSAVFPSMPGPPGAPPPGTAPSLTGISVPTDIPDIDVTSINPHDAYVPSAVLPPAGSPPTPVRAGGYENSKTIAETKARVGANQGLFFRWFHPGGPRPLSQSTWIIFYVGQFALYIRDVVLQVWEDTSAAGDRSAGEKVLTYPLWGYANEAEQRRSTETNRTPSPSLPPSHDRWLLWLPFRRNKVLLLSNLGRAHFLTTRPDTQIKRNADNTDWVNVREDTLRVKVWSPAWFGRFQIQKLKFADSGSLNGPISTIDYTPTNPPAVTAYYDADQGTTLTPTRTSPPAYSLPKKRADDCLDDANVPSSLVSRWGVQIAMTSPAPHHVTPFLYGYDVDAPRILTDSPLTQLDVADSGSSAKIIAAKFGLGHEAGAGRGEVQIHDVDPFPLASRYYRSAIPFQLKDGATVVFSGLTEPMEVKPFSSEATAPRALSVKLIDGWKLLARSFFNDEHDFTGVGHITAVIEVAKLAGIDTTTVETPPINTSLLDAKWNTKLSDLATLNVLSKAVKSPWATRVGESAASYLKRLVGLWSGWLLGFRADGTLYYLPREYFTTVTKRFYASEADATTAGNPTAPVYRDEVRFSTDEPEANVILVRSGSENNGAVLYSPLYVDWASIKNPAVANYLGYWRAEVVDVGGGFTCRHLNWIARQIWNQTRRRFRRIEVVAPFQTDVGVGHLVEFNPYGNYRIEEIAVNMVYQQDHHAQYRGVFDEAGY